MYIHAYIPCLGQKAHDEAVTANMVLVRELAAVTTFEQHGCACGKKYKKGGGSTSYGILFIISLSLSLSLYVSDSDKLFLSFSTVMDSGRGITGGGSGYAALLAHAG